MSSLYRKTEGRNRSEKVTLEVLSSRCQDDNWVKLFNIWLDSLARHSAEIYIFIINILAVVEIQGFYKVTQGEFYGVWTWGWPHLGSCVIQLYSSNKQPLNLIAFTQGQVHFFAHTTVFDELSTDLLLITGWWSLHLDASFHDCFQGRKENTNSPSRGAILRG